MNELITKKQATGKAHPSFTTMITGKGQVALERKYRVKEEEARAAA